MIVKKFPPDPVHIEFSVNGLPMEPDRLCAGSTIRLNAIGGNGVYSWERFNLGNPQGANQSNPGDPNRTYINVTTSDKYRVTSTQCGETATTNWTELTFRPALEQASIVGATSWCSGTIPDTEYAIGAIGADLVTWTIDNVAGGPGAPVQWMTGDAYAKNGHAKVTWPQTFSGPVTIHANVYGCEDRHYSKDLVINPTPRLLPSQCDITNASDITACTNQGPHQLSVSSNSSNVIGFKWYDSPTATLEASVSPQFVVHEFGGGRSSVLTKSFEQNESYWVEPVCSCGPLTNARTKVSFTVNPGSAISTRFADANGVTPNPGDLCQGDVVYLSVEGGTAPQWRLNDLLKETPDSESMSFQVTQSGTWYLKAVNSCGGGRKDGNPITINFAPAVSGLTLIKDDNHFCIGSDQKTVFTANSFNADLYTWTLSSPGRATPDVGSFTSIDNDSNPADHSKIEVTWNTAFTGTATITAVAWGCRNSQHPITIDLTVYPLPVASITPTTTVDVPYTQAYTTLTSSQVSGASYTWYLDDVQLNVVTPTYDVTNSGIYKVKVTEPAHNCFATSDGRMVRFENGYNLIIENTLLNDKKDDGSAITVSDIDDLDVKLRTRNIDYYDGLGRLMQTVVKQGSPARQDMVQPVVYDASGKEVTKYLPYVSSDNNGWYKKDAVRTSSGSYVGSSQQNFYNNPTSKIAVDAKPYATTAIEGSPLNRPLKEGAPGEAWQPNGNVSSMDDHTVKKTYEYNKEGEVYLFNYNTTTGQVTLSADVYYKPSNLFANRTFDEHNNETIEFVDMSGDVVCRKVQHGIDDSVEPPKTLYACTYYIYDEVGNIAVVLPPEAMKTIDKSEGN
jgi:hypothetical protein